MKKIFLALTALVMTGCAGSSMPEFPDIKYHYAIEVRGSEKDTTTLEKVISNYSEIPMMPKWQDVRCLKFQILNKIPYKIKYLPGDTPMKECDLIGGYQPADSTLLYNWLVDVKEWADKQKSRIQVPLK